MALHELSERRTVAEVLNDYRATVEAAKAQFKALGDTFDIAYHAGISSDKRWNIERVENDYMRDLKRSTWRYLVGISGIERVLSVKRQDDFENFLKDDLHVPEPTEQAIYEMLLGGSINELFRECIIEACEYLRPGAHQWNKLKTNHKNARNFVGSKIILERVFWFTNNMQDYARRKLYQVERIFYILDGQCPPDSSYHSPLMENMSVDTAGNTPYFSWKRYTNGNLHLVIKRPDLLKQFNQIAGGLTSFQLPD